VLYNFKIVSVLTLLKIVLLIVPINCKNFANLSSTSPNQIEQIFIKGQKINKNEYK